MIIIISVKVDKVKLTNAISKTKKKIRCHIRSETEKNKFSLVRKIIIILVKEKKKS